MLYILDNMGDPIPADIATWMRWMVETDRRVAADDLDGGVSLSTVFLGTCFGRATDAPQLWETMIFHGDHATALCRYTTEAAARRGHALALAEMRQQVAAQ